MTQAPPDKRTFTPQMRLHDIQALKSRSRRIDRLKYSLPGIAVISLAILVAWPQVQKWVHTPPTTLIQTPLQQANNTAIHPEYKSTDNKNQPYTITADRGVETSAEEIDLTRPKLVIHLKSGDEVTLTSNSGKLDKLTNTMRLIGNVTLIHSQGYRLETAEAWIDCAHGNAHSHSPVWGNGPAGAIEAKGFRLTERGTKVSFIGGMQLLFAQAKEKV